MENEKSLEDTREREREREREEKLTPLHALNKVHK